MLKLNTVTQRLDGTDYESYRLADLIDSIVEMTDEEISGLRNRLEYLERAELDDDEFDEKLKLRSMFL